MAHPLVVAAALGLLGPHALPEERDEREVTCRADSAEGCVHFAPEDLPEIDQMDFARVEQEWLAARDRDF